MCETRLEMHLFLVENWTYFFKSRNQLLPPETRLQWSFEELQHLVLHGLCPIWKKENG